MTSSKTRKQSIETLYDTNKTSSMDPHGFSEIVNRIRKKKAQAAPVKFARTVPCQLCKKRVPEDRLDRGLCPNCKRLTEIRDNIDSYLERAGVPIRYRSATFKNLEITKFNKAHARTCWGYVTNPGKNLFLYGDSGTGKTQHAAIIAKELIDRGKTVKFISIPKMIFENISQETAKKYGRIPFVVLDGFETKNKLVEYIIFERYNSFRHSIITSELSPQDVTQKMGKRIASRIFSSCLTLKFEGPDQRFSIKK